MKISQLDGKRVALWGWGREGHAAWRAVRSRLPGQPLTLFCNEREAAEAAALGDAALDVRTGVDGSALAAFDVVIKSPGISPYTVDALYAGGHGVTLIGGTSLWFGEHAGADGVVPRCVCVTGTKGKSTTTAMLAHLLRAAGHRTALAGNIGLPLLDLLDPQPVPDYWALELSSYQCPDVAPSGARPDVAVVLNIYPEHLDWHGSEARYVADKLSLVTRARPVHAVLNAADPHLADLALPDSQVHWFNTDQGWHLRGEDLYRGDARVLDTRTLPVPGHQNRSNLCAVLTAVEALGLDGVALAGAARGFTPLPNRLQALGERDGVLYVNDSISTTPHASLAALDWYRGRRVVLLAGGHDRGLDWHDFAAHMRHGEAPLGIVTMGQNGPRIHDLLAPLAADGLFRLEAAADLADAVARARAMLGGEGGVILLSPGAPSFGPYRDYVARGRHFAALAGFDPDTITAIPGMGVA